MIRVHVICEGQTEEMFVNQVLQARFQSRDIWFSPRLIGRPGHKGGKVNFHRLFTDVRQTLTGDPSAYCTTFFDFYGLDSGFPGRKEAEAQTDPTDKAACVIRALIGSMREKLGENPLHRLIPYIQMYEFEGLLFSDPAGLARGIDQDDLVTDFREIGNAFDTPEWINDSPNTAPSKRIKGVFPEYDKPLHGSLAALEIGLDAMMRECGLFRAWLDRIAALRPLDGSHA
ncbi:MAG: DUF4276 family protein [Magnetococcales bacterium]|nr:DUF4276 family protein [Magnetococcales bacterium]